MITDSNKEELIEQYILGELNGEMLKEFNEKLVSDDRFKSEVAIQTDLIRSIRLAGRSEWSSKLKALHEKMEEGAKEAETKEPVRDKVILLKKWYQKKHYLVAASVIGLLFISGLLYTTLNSSVDSERMFQANYIPYAYLGQGARSLPSDTLTLRDQAFQAYEQKNYAESIELFKSVLTKGEDETVLFYLGNAYLSADSAFEAESTFKEYLNKYKEFEAESKWYLSLSYLKQEKLNEARSMLEAISKENNDYSKKAMLILKDWQG